MNNVLKEKLKKILTYIDLIGVIITLKEFFIDHDYSVGVIVGVLSIGLGLIIQVFDNIIKFGIYLKSVFGLKYTSGMQKVFIAINIGYTIINITILHFSYKIYDDLYFGWTHIVGLPIMLSIITLIFRGLDNEISKYLVLYIIACVTPNIAMLLYCFVFDMHMEISFNNILNSIAFILLFIAPVFAGSVFVYNICTENWNQET